MGGAGRGTGGRLSTESMLFLVPSEGGPVGIGERGRPLAHRLKAQASGAPQLEHLGWSVRSTSSLLLLIPSPTMSIVQVVSMLVLTAQPPCSNVVVHDLPILSVYCGETIGHPALEQVVGRGDLGPEVGIPCDGSVVSKYGGENKDGKSHDY